MNISNYFLYFMIYSVLGWILEVVVKLITKRKFINRGFLIGPYCPIYGCGGLIILLCVGDRNPSMLTIFISAIIICSILEYSSSLVMEKIFKVRWWDYSNKKFNLNGRICLETMIPFGILAILVINFIQPNIEKMVSNLSKDQNITLSIILFIILMIDGLISTFILLKIRKTIKKEKKDNTQMAKKYIDEWLENNSVLYRRIKRAFPRFEIFKKNK